MRPAIDERETIIRIGRTSDVAEICTTDERYMTKFDKMCEEGEGWKLTDTEMSDGDVVEKFYECPRKLVSFRSKKVKQNMTEEQKAKLRERMRVLRASQNAKI